MQLRKPKAEISAAFKQELERRYTAAARRERHARSFLEFVRDAWHVVEPGRPLVEGWAFRALCRHLEAVSRGQLLHLLITLPPGLTKSLLVNVFWPAWEWGALNRPDLKILGISYKQDHARRDGRRMRQLVDSPWYQGLYGHRVKLISHADEWFETSALGWRKARSSGSVTGERCDRLVIDDPHNSGSVESQAEREAVVLNIRENVLNRVNDVESTPIVVIMQRLHEADIAGVIIRDQLGFEHLNLPMRFIADRPCTTTIGFTDPRTVEGELLFPERFSAASVDDQEKRMQPYAFLAQYQQTPVSREGAWFKRADIELTSAPPPLLKRLVMGWDLAATEATGSKDPDYTAGVLAGIDEANKIHVLEVMQFRMKTAMRNELIRATIALHGPDVLHHFPLEPGQAGLEQEDRFRRLFSGHQKLKFTRPLERKEIRAEGALIATQLGRVILHAFPKREAFINELCAFPGGRHDDQVDAFADVVRELEIRTAAQRYSDFLDNIG